MIRILYITYSLHPAGAERIIYSLAKNLDRSRFKPFICSLKHGGDLAAKFEDLRIPVFLLQKKRKFEYRVFKELRNIIINERIDIVHTHNFPANLWGRIAALSVHCPVIIATEHSLSIRKGWMQRKIDLFLSLHTDKIIAVSEAVRQSLVIDENISREKIITIANGVDFTQFRNLRDPLWVKQALGIDNGTPVIGIVGRLIKDKGHKYLIKAAELVLKKYPNVKFVVVGEGELKQQLFEMLQEIEIVNSFIFTGFRNDRLDYMATFTIAILSSIREGLPVTLLEYMALKQPIIVTRVGGMPEVIENGVSGIVVPEKNYHALAKSIIKLLGDERLRIKYGNNAWECVKNRYSQENMIRKTEKLYEEMSVKFTHSVSPNHLKT